MAYDSILAHLTMLQDAVRTEAYQRAIQEAVRPGDRVLDFGCGTGVLSIFAERAGAARVYAVDRSKMLAAAERVVADNGCTRIELIAGEGATVELPTEVDVIVSEWMGHFLFAETMLEPLLRLRDRFLARDGRMLPSACTLHAGLLKSPKHFEEMTFLRHKPYGIDFRAISEWPLCEPQGLKVPSEDLLPETTRICELDLQSAMTMPGKMSGSLTPSADDTVYGICGWFDAQLSNHVTLSTSPFEPNTHWAQVIFPFDQPLPVRAGQPVEIEVDVLAVDKDNAFAWRARTGEERRAGDSLVHNAWLARTRTKP